MLARNKRVGVSYQLCLGWTGGVAIGLDIGELVVVVGTRGPLELHVANIVACLDDDPSMQVNLETARAWSAWSANEWEEGGKVGRREKVGREDIT